MAASLHLQLLGEFRALHSDRPVTALAAPPLQALLARLVLHPGVQHPRAQLAYLFWPD